MIDFMNEVCAFHLHPSFNKYEYYSKLLSILHFYGTHLVIILYLHNPHSNYTSLLNLDIRVIRLFAITKYSIKTGLIKSELSKRDLLALQSI